jgi:dipeptidase E
VRTTGSAIAFRLGACPDELLRLCGGGRRAAIIANGMDAQDAESRAAGVALEVRALGRLGLACTELDLREFFRARPGALAAALGRYDAVWVRGGNVFVLRYALAASGADAALVRLLAADALVYAGYSAGPCVLAPSLRGLDTVDPPGRVTEAYGGVPLFAGLGVLPYAIVPHVDSPEHPATVPLCAVVARYRTEGVPHRALRDGDVLVVEGDQTRLCSGGRARR